MRAIKKNVLTALAIAFGILFLCVWAFSQWTMTRELKHDVQSKRASVNKLFQQELQNDTKIVKGITELLSQDQELQRIWLSKDRDRLLGYTLPIFEKLRNEFRITHFYFHALDRHNFLRVHNPTKFGDFIDRHTMDMAVSDQRIASGIELGPFGTFTLRVVVPWMINNSLAGFIELGEEIDHISQNVRTVIGVELIILIDKKLLVREKWEEGLLMMGRSGPTWDQFAKVVVTDQSIRVIPPKIEKLIVGHNHSDEPYDHDSSLLVFLPKEHLWQAGILPLRDVTEKVVGDIIVLHDIGEETALLSRLHFMLLFMTLAVSLTLFIFFWPFLSRIESNLHSQHRQILTEMDKRKKVERYLREAKKKAEYANKAKSEFLTNMSHEIRTPMNAIMGMTDLALQAELPPKIMKYLSAVKDSSNTLLGVINDILDFSRIESGKLDIEKIKFNLHDILSNILAMFKEKANEKSTDFCIETDDNVPDALLGDPLRLGQVLVNLIGNAIKFTDEGTVSLKIKSKTASDDQAQITFAVSDTGIGISPEKAKKIFNPFTQADGSTTRNFGGSGLGLTISQKLVVLMGGEIELFSTLDQGSTFSFSIPFEVQPLETQSVSEAHFGKKILVVDDEVMILTTLENLFTMSGFDVETASLPSEALKKLHDHQEQGVPFDLVIMDYMMPEQDGFATSKIIRNDPLLADTPIIMQTGFFGNEFSEQRAKQAGINAILFKPVGIKLFIEHIRNILDLGTNDKKAATGFNKEISTKLQGRKILLVEDNKFNQMLARDVLKNAGLHVRIANNGREAIEMLDKDIAAILMDVQMPVMDGFEATRMIRKQPQYAELPIIAMTAHAVSGYRDKCIKAGMNDYVTKPFKLEKLFDALTQNILPSQKKQKNSLRLHQEECRDDDLTVDPVCVGRHLQDTYKFSSEQIETMLQFSKNSLAEELVKAEDNLAQGDLDSLSKAAHSIKGVLRDLGLNTLATIAERIEKQQIRVNDEKEGALQQQFAILKNALSSFTALPPKN